MSIEIISYIIAFIISSGLAAIGILIAWQLYQIHQKAVFQVLFYQQIFLISFFIYGIWGNMALRELISDLNINQELSDKLSVFIPVLGTPFLILSWFMLIRFALLLNGFEKSKSAAIIYFPSVIVFVFVFALLVQQGIISSGDDPVLFIIQTLAGLNLFIHIFFILPFLIQKKYTPVINETGFTKTVASLYILAVIISSGALFFYNAFGYFSTCLAILLLFAAGIFIPVALKFREKPVVKEIARKNNGFEAFCKLYEISKREAEIILEICSGKTNKAISEKLFITLQTVKDHNHRIFMKTGVKTRVQLANLVREKAGI